MARLINLDKLLHDLADKRLKAEYMGLLDRIRNIVTAQPIINEKLVKLGYWKSCMASDCMGLNLDVSGGKDFVAETICSVCKEPAIVDEFGNIVLSNYCPNCGAKVVSDE